MKADKKQDWGKERQQGKWSYIRKYGVVGWGIQTFVIFYILLNVIEHGLNYSAYFSGNWITQISIYLLVFMAGGGAWGYWMWYANERKYNKENEAKKGNKKPTKS